MIFRLDGGVEVVSIVQAVIRLHVTVVLQQNTRQHTAQTSVAFNHLQDCRGSTGSLKIAEETDVALL